MFGRQFDYVTTAAFMDWKMILCKSKLVRFVAQDEYALPRVCLTCDLWMKIGLAQTCLPLGVYSH